jgi:hypothetical protein
MAITHAKVSAKSDGPDASQIRPSDWNADHDVGTTPQWASVNLQPSDILALETTPFEVVPAPGGRKYIVPILGIVHYRFDTTPYTGDGNNFVTGFGTSIAELVPNGVWSSGLGGAFSFDPADLLAQTVDAYGTFTYTTVDAWLVSELEDVPFVVAMNDGVGFAGGDGTLTVRLRYSVIDGAPPA